MGLIKVYTDGSCHTQQCVGSWVAIIFIANEKIILSGSEPNTTHNAMELLAVIKAIEFIIKQANGAHCAIEIISDSQYVVGLLARKQKFETTNYLTKKGKDVRNVLLVKQLLSYLEKQPISFTKIKAHQQKTTETQYNIEADLLCRKLLRERVF